MTQEEIDTLVSYLENLTISDMRDGHYDISLSRNEVEYIIESINLNNG